MKKTLMLGLGVLAMGVGAFASVASRAPASVSATIGDGNTFSGEYYIYYVSDQSYETNNRIHAWNTYGDFDDWPGAMIRDNSTNVTGVMQFQGNSHQIYKISFSRPLTGLKFAYSSNGKDADSESPNKTFTNGAAYWWNDTVGNVDAGLALDLLVKTEAARNAVSAWGTHELNYSICGIAPATAASLYNEYYHLSDSVKTTYISSSRTYTYTADDGSTEGIVGFSDIFAQLKKIAVDGGQSVDGASIIAPASYEETNTALVISIAAVSSILAMGTVFFVRKRKDNR